MKITQFIANGNIQKFGPNKDMESFWFDDRERCTDTQLILTPFVIIQNGEVTTTFCNDDDEKDPYMKFFQNVQEVKRLLSIGYSRHENKEKIFYRNYGEMNYNEARNQCTEDGTSLPVPQSGLISNRLGKYILSNQSLSKVRC